MTTASFRSLLWATAVAVVMLVPAARADDTQLATEDGLVRAALPGTWRSSKSDDGLFAAGFLGAKRAEFGARVLSTTGDGPAAGAAWKAWRTGLGGEPVFADAQGSGSSGFCFTAHSDKQGTVDYVRVVPGKTSVAVAWLRVSGAPGVVAEEAWAALGAVEVGPVAPVAGAGGTAGGGTEKAPATVELKDAALRIAVTFPEGFAIRKDVTPDPRRAISVIGTVGSDKHAYADVYLFDDFRWTEAVATWWRETERRGWQKPVRFEGDHLAFTMEVQDEIWTRHVRILDTSAGIVGVKLDLMSQAGKAATACLDEVCAGLRVIVPRVDPPKPPLDFAIEAGEGVTVFTETPGAEAIRLEAEEVERQVTDLTGLAPRDGRGAVVIVYADRAKLGVSQRLSGLPEDAAATFDARAGVVRTFPKPLGEIVDRQRLREELARDALHRRLGFPAPWWVERGLALVIGSGAHFRGKINKPHPDLIEGARDSGAGSADFEGVRWWTTDDAAGDPEREAVVWSYVFLFSLDVPPGKRWRVKFLEYLKVLQSSGDPVAANKVFDFADEAAFLDEWGTWVRRL